MFKRTPLGERRLPDYTRGEEIFNMTSHIAGGVAYTAGAVLYALGKKRRYFHSVFHLFVLAGSVLHFFCILLYIL